MHDCIRQNNHSCLPFHVHPWKPAHRESRSKTQHQTEQAQATRDLLLFKSDPKQKEQLLWRWAAKQLAGAQEMCTVAVLDFLANLFNYINISLIEACADF